MAGVIGGIFGVLVWLATVLVLIGVVAFMANFGPYKIDGDGDPQGTLVERLAIESRQLWCHHKCLTCLMRTLVMSFPQKLIFRARTSLTGARCPDSVIRVLRPAVFPDAARVTPAPPIGVERTTPLIQVRPSTPVHTLLATSRQ